MGLPIEPVSVEMGYEWTSFGRNDSSYFTLTSCGRNANMIEGFIMLHMLDRQTMDIYFTLSILIFETQE